MLAHWEVIENQSSETSSRKAATTVNPETAGKARQNHPEAYVVRPG